MNAMTNNPRYQRLGLMDYLAAAAADGAPWWAAFVRAYYVPAPHDRVMSRTSSPRVLAHEWGHAAGIEHEPWWRFDMMSAHPFRVFDRHGVMARSAGWRKRAAGGRA